MTLKARDLRIGNKVIVNHRHDIEGVVTGITEDAITVEFERQEDLCNGLIVSPEKVIGIPLTEEWHNKFGIEKDGFISFEYKINDRKKIIFSGDYIYLRDIHDM